MNDGSTAGVEGDTDCLVCSLVMSLVGNTLDVVDLAVDMVRDDGGMVKKGERGWVRGRYKDAFVYTRTLYTFRDWVKLQGDQSVIAIWTVVKAFGAFRRHLISI